MIKNEHILLKKVLYTLMVILVYIIGRNIPLYGVDLDAYRNVDINAQTVFLQSLSGDFSNASLFILGLWPYMLSSMILMIYAAIKSVDKTSKISPKKMNILTYEIMLVVGGLYALNKIRYFKYTATGMNLIIVKIIVFLELMAGMVIVIYLCSRNQKYGVGARTSIFLVNIVSGIKVMVLGKDLKMLVIPFIIGFFEIAIMLILETTEKRMPVQRVSIHNIYADKNYIAYKLNPAGVMPLMFSSVMFMLPQFVFSVLAYTFPNNESLEWISDNMALTSRLGIAVYIGIVWLLTIVFAQLMLQPWKTAEQLMKGGDSILDIYAGKETKRYLFRTVFRFSVYSSVVLSVCIGVPLILQFEGYIDSSVVMLPISIMMATGIWISLYREAVVYKNMDKYRPFV